MPALIRARHPQMLLELLAERHPAAHAQVVPALACGEKLAHAHAVEWIPVEMDIEVIEAVAKQLTPAQMSALVSERQRREMGSALFRTFVATAQKIFGLSPPTMLRHLPRGWRQVFSDCGEPDIVRVGSNEGIVMLRGLPDSCLASSIWVGVLPDGMRVMFELIHAKGDVAVTQRGRDVEMRFTW